MEVMNTNYKSREISVMEEKNGTVPLMMEGRKRAQTEEGGGRREEDEQVKIGEIRKSI